MASKCSCKYTTGLCNSCVCVPKKVEPAATASLARATGAPIRCTTGVCSGCVCAQGSTPCTTCNSQRCSNQATPLPNPPAPPLTLGPMALRLKRCVPASQLVPPPPKRKCSTASKEIYMGGLPPKTTKGEIRSALHCFGGTSSVDIPGRREGRGFAFARFFSEESARMAVEKKKNIDQRKKCV
ncbi:uncharacterized protein LOC135349621 isoform X2 [Halichondria panicea]|uniref:uncharacterized protein LOC135349621 isoform X2 n=1 Tax=Halichondria panicea TaxID=6063 RepID=UPI00312B2B28